jgi:hypothetical protein
MVDESTEPDHSRYTILMPSFEDWDSIRLLLPRIDASLRGAGKQARVLVVDDGSTTPMPDDLLGAPPSALTHVEVLRLLHNVGHQRAICIGLCHSLEHLPLHSLVVMDCDGEDDPNDIPRLMSRAESESGRKVVFAERTRRSESMTFRFFYFIYRGVHLLLVGQNVRFGNFSVLPASFKKRMAVVPELWNHYAAAILLARQPYCALPCKRTKRIAGESKMNFSSLVMHGLSALAVFSSRVGTRLLLASMIMIAATVMAMIVVVGVRLATDLAIPGWASYSFGILLIMLGQLTLLAVTICFIVLSLRSGGEFIPVRDYRLFVDDSTLIWNADD